MRILIVGLNYAPEPTGIAPYTTAVAEGLTSIGHRVRAVTAKPHYPKWEVAEGYAGRVVREPQRRGVHVARVTHYVPTRPSGMQRLFSEISFGLHAVIGRWGLPHAVVLVSPALFASAIALARARIRHVPSVVWLQDIYSLGIVETTARSSGGVVVRVIRAVESWTLTHADAVCVIHERFRGVALELGAEPTRLHVVRNWSHLPALALRSRADERGAFGWGDEVRVLHTGAMGHKQDLDNVVRAARIAESEGLPVRFVLTGGGSERARLEREASGIATIEFWDPLPDERYQAALLAADVLLVNEHVGLRQMAVPSKLTSYFASGRPVVAATDEDSVTAEEIAASGAGVRVPAGEPRAILDAVMALHRDPGRAAELGAAGLRYRDEVLSAATAVAQFAQVLATVAPEGTPRPKPLLRRLSRAVDETS